MKLFKIGSSRSEKVYTAIVLCSTLLFVGVLVLTPEIFEYWNFLPDCKDYLRQSELDILSLDFWMPQPGLGFNPRPFTVPLMFKLTGSDFYTFIYFQKLFYCFAVFCFIFSFTSYFSGYTLKSIVHLFLLFFFTWWDIVGWSEIPVSEFMSFSFFLLWIATILKYYRKQNLFTVAVLIIVTTLFSFTRDTWPYLISVFFFIHLFLHKSKSWKIKITNLSMFLYVLIIFFVQSYTVTIGRRASLPVFNSIVFRIVQNDKYFQWFKKEGLPMSEQLLTEFKGKSSENFEDLQKIYISYYDPEHQEIHRWIWPNGKAVMHKFLLHHPSYLFMQDQTKEQISRIFTHNIKNYYGKPYKAFLPAYYFFPIFNYWLVVILVIFCFGLWFRNKKWIYLFPVIIALLTTMNVFLSYNADTLEVNRHLFMTVICKELIGIISLSILINYIIRNFHIVKRRRVVVQ